MVQTQVNIPNLNQSFNLNLYKKKMVIIGQNRYFNRQIGGFDVNKSENLKYKLI